MCGEYVNEIRGHIIRNLNKYKRVHRRESDNTRWWDPDRMVEGCDKIMQCLEKMLRNIARDMEVKVEDYFDYGDREEARRLAKMAFA